MFSLTASGTLGDVITYSNWKGLAYVRSRVIPSNPQTASQTSCRSTMCAAVSMWQSGSCVNATSKASWDYYASGTGMSGFNRYVKKFIELNTQQASPWLCPGPGDAPAC